MAAPTSLAAIFTVTTADDGTDGVCDVLNCTLREAIDAANTTSGSDAITFQIGVGGPATIRPFSPLPQITDPVLVDGTTQPGYSGSPLIELDGSFLGTGAAGLSVATSSSGIQGLAVNRFPGNGIELVGAGDHNVVTSNYVGVGLDGVTARGNGNGVASSSQSNTIGGPAAALRNVISGNTQNGIELTGGGANTVEGNFVGTDASGNVAVPNLRGLAVNSDENTIGNASGGRNVVSGNSNSGLFITGSNNDVTGNYIGTDADATTAVPNGFGGVYILGGATSASANTLTANVISGNASFGALIASSEPNSAANNVFDTNLIGTDATGQKPLGNAGPGVAIGSGSGIGHNVIGDSPSSSNTIAFNSKGISIGPNTARNRFSANSIHDNTFIGIDLDDDGVTPNDPGDGDTGANELVNFPVLSTVVRNADGTVTVSGTYDGSLPSSPYQLDFYATPACDGSGNGQGGTWLGSQSSLSDGGGDFSFNTDNLLTGNVAPGSVITATATDTLGDTSEFSACKSVPAGTTTKFTVDTTDGTTDGSCGGGDCSLGDAITAANASPGTDTIEFNLPGPSLVITPTPSLPAITGGVVIDGTTQPGFSASSRVNVDGAGTTGDGFVVDPGVDGSTIRGLSITGFPGAGIALSGPPSVVEGNYIGVKPDGTGPGGNGSGSTFHGGILVGSEGNRIGGTTAATRNIISANNPSGIVITQGAANVILGNRIGTNVDGDHAVPNAQNGIYLPDPLGVPTIGGGAPGAGNLISGNTGSGIWIEAGDGAVIQGNTVGLAVDAATPMPNGADGIHAEFAGGRIGGVGSGEANVVSGNGGAGIALVNVSSAPTKVQGNVVGLKASGDALAPNGAGQVVVSGSDSIDIGGATAAARNVISGGGSSNGVLLDSGTHDVLVQGNYIGTDSTGTVGLGNGDGVVVAAGSHDNTIGGSVAGARNVISASSQAGVRFDLAGTGNRVLGNSIGTNKDETTVLANDIGIELTGTAGTIVGSAVPPIGNVIAGSTEAGVVLDTGSDSNTFAGNYVGTDRTDTADFGNADGMRFQTGGGSNNVIGPTNVFAHSVDRGIEMNTGSGNRISASTFHDNGNDAIFIAEAANHDQSAPTVDSAVDDAGTVHVDGTLGSTANSSFFVELFSTPSCTAKPQGQTYLGFTTVTTDEIGNGSFSFSSNVPSEGDAITATATNQGTLDTSAFSACTTVANPTLVVTTADDHDDGICDSDCTLREALNVSNISEGRINISFAIDASGTQTITLASGLPNITNPVVIDGTTEIDHQLSNGFGLPAAGEPAIEITGINEVAADGLVLASGSSSSTLRGLGVQNFTLGTFEGFGASGVRVSSSGNKLEDLYVGTSSTGLLARPNDNGIVVTGDGNTIGPGNLVSGNSSYGIFIDGTVTGAVDNVVTGNLVGTDRTGNAPLPDNIAIAAYDAPRTIIGGPTATDGNVAVGDEDGIDVSGTIGTDNASEIRFNNVGVGKDGITAMPQSFAWAVGVSKADHAVVADNVIGHGESGLAVAGSNDVTIVRNFVGADRSGGVQPNTLQGIYVQQFGAPSHPTGTVVGGSVADGNVVRNNPWEGIILENVDQTTVTGNVVQDNATTNGAGVAVTGGVGNTISQNSIDHNGRLGIDLGDDGVTPNDPGSGGQDADVGPNDFQNFPELASATVSNGTVRVSGTLPSNNNTHYTVEFFVSHDPDSSGNGEGDLYIGSTSVTTSAVGLVPIHATFTPGPDVIPGKWLTATATAEDGSTSEFSQAVQLKAPAETSIEIAPEADTFVAAGAPDTNFGTADYADTYGGHNPSCVLANGTSYTLMRFDLSAIPLGAKISRVELDTTTRAGWAQDGDPAHWALFLPNDSWSETGVTWNTRPADGLTTVGDPAFSGGPDIRNSNLALGAADVWRSGCNSDPDPAGNQAKVFPSTTDGFPRSVETAEADFINRVSSERAEDGKLSLELWTPNCGVCSVGNNLSYWARYYTRDAANPAVRPRLVVTFANPPVVTNLQLTGPDSTVAGAGTVKLANVPPSVLLRPQTTTQAAPVNDVPVNDIPVNDVPVNDVPVNDIGFDDLAATVPALGNITLSSIPLKRPGGWIAALSDAPGTPLAGAPLQNVTLRDYYALPTSVSPETRAQNPIAPITLGDLDLSQSPLGSLPASAIVLANVKLSDLASLATWCTAFGRAYCSTATDLTGATVMSAALQGAPVNDVPVNDVPVNDIPVNDIPVNDVPVNDVALAGSPVNDIPVNDVPVNDVPVNDVPVNDIPVNDIMAHNTSPAHSPVNDIPVNDIATPNDVIFCSTVQPQPAHTVDCRTATLGQAYAAGAIRPGITLGDLRRADGGPPSAFDGVTLGDLHFFGDVTLGGLIESLPNGAMTLGDYFLLVLRSPTAQQGLGWEQLNIFNSGLPAFATGAPTLPYEATFGVRPGPGGASGSAEVDVETTLPSGFLYDAGTARLVEQPNACVPAAGIEDPTETVLADGRRTLRWTVDTVVGRDYRLCFTARPGLVLGPQAASLDVTPVEGANETAPPEDVSVNETFPANDTPETGQPIDTDAFLLSYVTSADDVDYYRYDPTNKPAVGSRVTVHLSHLPADYDLVVYGPQQAQLRPPSSTGVPLDGEPLLDNGFELSHTTDPLPSQTLDDLHLQQNLPLVGVSANRNDDPEDVVFTYDGVGPYIIQVTGYDGATSAKPYMLRVTTAAPPTPANVPARPSGPTQGPVLGTLPTGLNTVFLVNRQQLAGQYGDTLAASVITTLQNNLTALSGLGFPSAILSVDRYTAVQAAYAAWNLSPGDPAKANAVIAAINTVVDQQIRQAPNGAGLKYLVLVGGDPVFPFARLGDFTAIANESNYASTFGPNSDLFSSLRLGNFLSDDPYGDVNPVPYLNRQLYIPELAVGRLVETPAQMIGAIGRFVSFSGRLDPQTSLTTGYDFLTDGAQRVKTSLDGRVGVTHSDQLINETWDKNQLVAKLLPAGGAPSIVSLNGHADHYRFQAPLNATGPNRPPLFTTGDLVASNSSRTNRLIFSMGCHAGLSVADSVVTAGTSVSTIDWPQAYMGWATGANPDQNARTLGVGAYLGNTGFGYGDTTTVAYSEEVNQLFAKRIALGSAVGDALVGAKQEYFGGRGVFGVYDEKAMAEFTLYGLPMWSVTGPPGMAAPTSAAAPDTGTLALSAKGTTAAPTADADAAITDPSTGLEAQTFDVDPIANTEHTPPVAGGRFWEGPDGVQVSHLRPLQPKMYIPLTGATAHGALLTALRSSDLSDIDPVYARPLVDLNANEPELAFGDVAFPSRLQAVRTFETPTGRMQRVVIVTGQFFSNDTADPNGKGTQRLFSRVGGRVFKSTSQDYIPPAFQLIDAATIGSTTPFTAAFKVDVTDLMPTGPGTTGPGTVKRVLVGVRSGTSQNWTFTDLAQSSSVPKRWTGGTPITDTHFEYFVQAVDAAGNVAVSTNKGFYFVGATLPASTGGIDGSLSGQKNGDWFTGAAALSITKPDGVKVEVSVDGGLFGPAPDSITGDGVHTIDIRGSNGGTDSLIAPIDTTPPEIVIGTPANGGTYVLNSSVPADYTCRDSGSGVATPCTGTVPNGTNIDTSSVGTKTFTVQGVTDAAGRSTPARTVTYTVGLRKIVFSSGRTGDGDIYTTTPDGSGLARLTTSPKIDEQPALSPDGTKIAFGSKRDDSNGKGTEIYVMDADGQNVKRLTNAKDDDTAPAWSADGRKIAFQSKRDGNPEIYVMNADGTGQTRLTNNSKQDIEPTWSPNGQRIAFMSDRMGGPNIWVMDSTGANVTQLTFTKQPEGDPAWSPDGSLIAFGSKRSDANGTAFDIFTMKPDGTNVTRLTSAKNDDFEPAWSRDGLKIVFTGQRDGNPELYVMNANGTGQTRVTTSGGFDRQPDW